MAEKLLIDLGKNYITARFKDKQVRERNLGVFEKGEELKLVASGGAALELLKNPPDENHIVIAPFAGDRVAYPKPCGLILGDIFKREFPRLRKSAEVYVTVRLSVKQLHMKALYDVFKDMGFRDVTLIDSLLTLVPYVHFAPVAIIGASGSDIGILDDGIIEGCSTSVGGDYLDRLIAEKIEKVYKLKISPAAAEYIKFEVASLIPADLFSTKVTGQNIITGEILTTTVTTNDIREEVISAYTKILEIMDSLFTLLPDNLLEAIEEKSIYIAGGGANIKGIESFFENYFHRPAVLSPQPELSVIQGLAKLAERDKTLAALLKLQR
jgi:rod shape-determining protein MreB